jgi:hypothetical protein
MAIAFAGDEKGCLGLMSSCHQPFLITTGIINL